MRAPAVIEKQAEPSHADKRSREKQVGAVAGGKKGARIRPRLRGRRRPDLRFGHARQEKIVTPLAPPASSSRDRLRSGEERSELGVVGKIVREPSRDLGRLRHVALPDVHVPEREFRFGVREEV